MSKRIENLTPEQIARFPEFQNKWTKIGLAAGPTDRAAVEAGVDAAYKAAGLNPPALKIWLRSPVEGVVGVAMLGGKKCINVLPQVRDLIVAQVGDQIRNQITNEVRNEVADLIGARIVATGANIWTKVKNCVESQHKIFELTDTMVQVGDFVQNEIKRQIRDQIRDQLQNQVQTYLHLTKSQIRSQIGDLVWTWCGYGSQDNLWASYYDYIGSVLNLDVQRLAGLIEMTKGGWWWPFDNFVVLTELPIAIHFDERNRIHHPTRAAVEYADGWGVYSWHGTDVPSEWILQPSKRDPNLVLTWPNVEQRRALAEIIGWDRVLSNLSPTVVDEDADPQVGTLLRVDLPDSPGEQFLRVRCGTGRTFVLPVPASCRTALEANASTYDVPPEVIRLLEVRS